METTLFALVALGYLMGAVGWLRTSKSALDRARGLERHGRPAEQWRTLAAKDALGSLLFLGLAVITVAEASERHFSAADAFLVLGVGPVALALRLGRRFERLSAQVEAIEDVAQRNAEVAVQRDFFADRFAERLAGLGDAKLPGVKLHSVYEPVEGALGGDFVGVGTVGGRLDLVIGDVTGHGFDAAVDAMRLKDLLLAELRAGQSPARALSVANAFFYTDTVGETFATAFVAQYDGGVLAYANAGHPPAMIVRNKGELELEPTGPLLGVSPSPSFDLVDVLLAPGERLVAFTDGLIEAYGAAGGLKGTDIANMVRHNGIECLLSAVLKARREPVRDDIALLELLRLPAEIPAIATTPKRVTTRRRIVRPAPAIEG